MCIMMVSDQPHHHSFPTALITWEHFFFLQDAVMADLIADFWSESSQAKAQGISDETNILFEELRVHFLEEKEIFADLVCKVYMLIVEFEIALILHISLPDSHPSAKLYHLLKASE